MFLFKNIKARSQNIFLALCLLSTTKIIAQKNLVPNPSFEQYTKCPFNRNLAEQISSKPNFWYKPDNRYGGYFNSCSNDSSIIGVPYQRLVGGYSYQNPKSGNAYIGMFHFGFILHYFEVKLLDSLKPNKKYYGECFVSLANTNIVACNNQSMFFSKEAIFVDTANCDTLLRNPQIYNVGNPIIADTLNWVKVSGIFTAEGGEQFLTLGNFRKNTQRLQFQNTGGGGAYYYYDDVAVYEINDNFCIKADAGRDTTISVNDSVFVGSSTNGIDTIKWYNATGQVIDSVKPGFWVHPNAAGSYKYIVEQIVNGCLTKDTINISVVLPLNFTSFAIFPSLGGVRGGFSTSNEINVSHYNIQRSIDGIHFETIGKVVAKNNSYNEYNYVDNSTPLEGLGVVYYRVVGIDRDGKTTLSEIKKLEIKNKKSEISIYPNPAKNQFNIISNKPIKNIEIYDFMGKQVVAKSVNSITAIFNDLKLAKGIYLVKALLQNNIVETQKLIIE